jgi:uncharacterized membrane protein
MSGIGELPVDAHTITARAAGPGELSPSAGRARLDSIDLLRGLAIVFMALDHTRDFFGASGQSPRDISQPLLFLTRWATHFCAPSFIFLAGVSAYLYGSKGRSIGELGRFLLSRGLWIILMEFTVVRFGWNLNLDSHLFIAQVMWAIGASMIVLAALVHLPREAIAVIGLVMIAGHNLLDGIRAEDLGGIGWIWNVLHQPSMIQIGPNSKLLILYPLVPWPGVMAMGYALGSVFKLDPASRRHFLLWTGTTVIAGFVLLRATNLYGDPGTWGVQDSWLGTLLSFINCEKYPPSLLYLMMTLGPALVLLTLFERVQGRIANWITTYGRVPFLFYVVHLPLIHALAVGLAWLTLGDVGWMFGRFVPGKPAGYGLSIFDIYVVWLSVVVVLYPLCRWFAALKQRRHDWWLSYL